MSSLAVAVRATAHTLRSIYLKQMLSDAAPLCGGKMRPTRSIPSLSLCSFPVSLPRCSFPLSLSLFPSPWNHTHCSPLLPSVFPLLYSASILFRPPLSFNQGCFLRVPSASCSLCIQHSPSLSLLSSVHASCRNWGPGSNRSDGFNRYAVVGKSRTGVFFFFFFLVIVNRWN